MSYWWHQRAFKHNHFFWQKVGTINSHREWCWWMGGTNGLDWIGVFLASVTPIGYTGRATGVTEGSAAQWLVPNILLGHHRLFRPHQQHCHHHHHYHCYHHCHHFHHHLSETDVELLDSGALSQVVGEVGASIDADNQRADEEHRKSQEAPHIFLRHHHHQILAFASATPTRWCCVVTFTQQEDNEEAEHFHQSNVHQGWAATGATSTPPAAPGGAGALTADDLHNSSTPALLLQWWQTERQNANTHTKTNKQEKDMASSSTSPHWNHFVLKRCWCDLAPDDLSGV